jgi:L-lactate dehydrogenase complex protein LldG
MDREPFLAEIAARLGRPRQKTAPVREYRGPAPRLADIPAHELAARFARELEAVGGEVVLARSAEDACAALAAELRRARGFVSWSRTELARSSGLDLSSLWQELGERGREPSAPDFRAAALAAEVGVTGVEHAVADTGSLVLSAGVGRPRSVSLLPRLHVALVREGQLLVRLGLSLARFREHAPSAVHFITGPSRTSDIENDLSIGVHGPARVLAIVVPEERA